MAIDDLMVVVGGIRYRAEDAKFLGLVADPAAQPAVPVTDTLSVGGVTEVDQLHTILDVASTELPVIVPESATEAETVESEPEAEPAVETAPVETKAVTPANKARAPRNKAATAPAKTGRAKDDNTAATPVSGD